MLQQFIRFPEFNECTVPFMKNFNLCVPGQVMEAIMTVILKFLTHEIRLELLNGFDTLCAA